MRDASPWRRWGGLTPAERRILAWVAALLLLGVLARAWYHRHPGDSGAGTAGPAAEERL